MYTVFFPPYISIVINLYNTDFYVYWFFSMYSIGYLFIYFSLYNHCCIYTILLMKKKNLLVFVFTTYTSIVFIIKFVLY